MPSSGTVAVVDDHPLYRSGVVRTLEENDFAVVAEGASADEAVAICAAHAPALILLDVSMPGSGVEAARQIAVAYPRVKMVMLTVSENDEDIMNTLEAGAAGYVLKGVSASELVHVLRLVLAGESYVSPSLAARLLKTMNGSRTVERVDETAVLTAREEQILWLVADGLSNKEIGKRLRLQEKTIKHYMTNVLQKLQVRNRTEAALKARATLEGRNRRV